MQCNHDVPRPLRLANLSSIAPMAPRPPGLGERALRLHTPQPTPSDLPQPTPSDVPQPGDIQEPKTPPEVVPDPIPPEVIEPPLPHEHPPVREPGQPVPVQGRACAPLPPGR